MRRYIPAIAIVFALAVLSLGTVTQAGETSKLSVEGMTCQGCVNKVESAVKDVDGVESVKVDLESNSAEVTYASANQMPAIEKAIADAGFSVKTADMTEKSGESMDAKAGKTCGEKSAGCCADKDKSAKKKGKDI